MEGLLIDLSELSELLLTGSIPNFEENRAVVGVEGNVSDIDSSGC
jgi:hypothetical protein